MSLPDKHRWDISDIALLYRDEDIAVINKPSGMFTHAGFGLEGVDATALTAQTLGLERIHTIHRLDRATSGVLVFALTTPAGRALHQTFANHQVQKRYWAIVWGEPPERGDINAPLPRRRGRPGTVEAHTHFMTRHVTRQVQVGCVSLVEAHPRQGRNHQIRRHLAGLGFPIVGDMRYGRTAATRTQRRWLPMPRLALHARQLTFPHPIRGEDLTLTAPLHSDFEESLQRMGALSQDR